MTKEEMLNGMSEEEFYDMYPTQEDWENSQQMKLGGLSGAPHNGQPTANEFFSYGSHVNDGLNIPMSNPFYAAHGGTYYGGPTRPYDMGGNTASPMNYGAFSVPMQYGGYEQEYGGVIDPGNNQDYPILEQGGKSALMDIIKAHSKKMRKSYENGGDTVMQGGNSTDYPTNIRNTFKSVLKRNIQNHMINEEEKEFSNEMMQVGGFSGGPGMNYGATNFNETNEQNASLANMYQQRINDTKDNLTNDFNNLGNATNYLAATANPYQKTSFKAKDGVDTGKQRTLSEEEWEWLDEQRKAKENKTDYNKYFGESARGTSGMTYFPMNYNPYTKISKGDVAKLKQIAATPTSGWQLKEFNHRHFGPWGKTNMKFGYRDETPFTENKVDPALIDPTKKQIIDEMAANPNNNLIGPGLNPNSVPSGYDFPGKVPTQYGPIRIEGRDYDFDRKYQDGGFSRVGPQGQTVEMMMNPFNHGNAFAGDTEDVSDVPSERYYPETMNPIQAGMPQMSYEDQEANLASILNDVPNPARVSYRNTSDNKPKIVNRESAVKIKPQVKPIKGVQTPIKKAPAPKTLPVKSNVKSSVPMPGVTRTPINTVPKKASTPPAKKLTQNTGDKRKAPQSGVVVDKRTNQAYYIGDKKQSGSFPVLTGKNVESNYNPYNVTELGNNPSLRATPVGYYKMQTPDLSLPNIKQLPLMEDTGKKGKPGSYYNYIMKDYKGKFRDITPISAYGMPAPVASNLGFHRTYADDAFNPKDPEFVRRTKLLNSQNPNMRCTTFGCVNAADASYDEIARVFPTSDTLMVLDSKNPLDAEILRQFKIRAKQKKYGGLIRAQYGRDQKSTNSADGTYDNFGNPIGLSSATGNMGLASSNMITGNQGIYSSTDTSFQPAGNAPGAAPISFEGAPKKTTPTPESVGLQQKNVEMKGMGTEKELDVTTKDRPGFDNEAMVNWGIAGMNALASGLEQGQNAKNQKQLSNLQLADNAFVSTPANAQSRGDYDPNSGMFRMDQMNPVQFPGGMGYSAYGGSFQDGGMQDQAAPQQEQIMQGVASMLQQGAQPEQVAQQLVQMGIPQEQAIQIIQTVMQQMQGGQEQTMQPAMRYGGYAMGGYQEDEESYEDDLNEDEIDELRRQGYNIEYLD